MKLSRWTLDMLRNRPEGLLKLLIRAHEIDVLDRSVSAAFRAGLRIGAAHPELADSVFVTEESPAPLTRGRASRWLKR